jgi:hypothetical protein
MKGLDKEILEDGGKGWGGGINIATLTEVFLTLTEVFLP